jgi:ketol-acid reductoisomerase
VAVSQSEKAIPEADVVILAVPDIAIKKISEDIIPQMKSGAW